MRSHVHPNDKTRYRLRNWAAYDRALAARGDITLWLTPEAIAVWNSKPTDRRGGQEKYLDLAILSSLTIRGVVVASSFTSPWTAKGASMPTA